MKKLALAAALVSLALPASASAQLSGVTGTVEQTLLTWNQILPGLTPGYVPGDPNPCKSGKPQCVDAVEKEMERRIAPLIESCHHNSMFALLYLEVTDKIGQAVRRTDGFFDTPGYVGHVGGVFADYYFRAYDQWAAGGTNQAWQIALDAAQNKQVSGLGNLMLGMSAHINRDLPFVLESIGLNKPDGTSRKPDHDKVNEVLYTAYLPAMIEAQRRLDPSVSGDEQTAAFAMQAVIGWREEAWRWAERLAMAANAADRALVTEQIEARAALEAHTLKTTFASSDSSARDAHCAAHHDDV